MTEEQIQAIVKELVNMATTMIDNSARDAVRLQRIAVSLEDMCLGKKLLKEIVQEADDG